jgi:hypothetical protein
MNLYSYFPYFFIDILKFGTPVFHLMHWVDMPFVETGAVKATHLLKGVK